MIFWLEHYVLVDVRTDDQNNRVGNSENSWIPFREIHMTCAYGKFCEGNMYLNLLLLPADKIPAIRAKITWGYQGVRARNEVLLEYERFGAITYDKLVDLPNRFTTEYWVVAKVRAYTTKDSKRNVSVDVDILNVHFVADVYPTFFLTTPKTLSLQHNNNI